MSPLHGGKRLFLLLLASVGAAPLAFSNVLMLIGTRDILGSAPPALKVIFSRRNCSPASAHTCWEENSVLSQPPVGHV